MAWTTPRTWTTGELVTAAIMNTHVRDNLNALGDDSRVRAYAPADVTLLNQTVTIIPLAAESFDTSAMHDTVTNNSRVNILRTGPHLVVGTVAHSANAGQVQARVHKNGTAIGIALGQGSASLSEQPKVVDVFGLVAGDYLELGAYQTSGVSASAYGADVSTYLLVVPLKP